MTQDPHALPGGPDEGLPPADPALRRMLDAAPDHDAAPNRATREAILRAAHDALAPSPLVAKPRDAARPWWTRLWGGAPGSRMPWNAAFATVLLALFVTVLWHREPVPDARLDAEAPAAPAAPPSAPPVPPPAPAPAPATVAPDARPSATDSAPAPAPGLSATPREREPTARADARALREQRRSAGEADDASKQQARPAAKAQAEALAERREAGPPPPALAPPSEAADKAQPPAAPVAPQADLAASPAQGTAAPPAALARRSAAPAAHPGAWRGWTHLRIVDPNGQSRRLARADAAPLSALIDAAIPARGGDAPADAPPATDGWRLVLEGAQGAALGVLEVPAAPGRTLRWREGTAPPVAAEPPPAVIEALRRALFER